MQKSVTTSRGTVEGRRDDEVRSASRITRLSFETPPNAAFRHVMKLSFSLNKPKASAAAPASSLKRPAAFGSTEDDEPIDAAPTSSGDLRSHDGVAANKKLLAQNVGASKTLKKRMEAEMKVDATVFEYDEVWDRMQEVRQRQKEAKEHDALERKVRAFIGLLRRVSFPQPTGYSLNTFTVCSRPRKHDGWTGCGQRRR